MSLPPPMSKILSPVSIDVYGKLRSMQSPSRVLNIYFNASRIFRISSTSNVSSSLRQEE